MDDKQAHRAPSAAQPPRQHVQSVAGIDTPPVNPQPAITTVKPLTRTPRLAHGTAREFSVGSIICDRFLLKDILGQGGMGAVYSAVDLTEAGNTEARANIAIKLLCGDFQHHPHALLTFQREAKKTQALVHPNIVKVYDFDCDDDIVYLTMERLVGASLIDVIQGRVTRQFSFNERLKMVKQIADGLAYAHRKGIVHSDLKPANLFLTDSHGIKILDFGIARAVNKEFFHDGFDASELGALTLSYASPEMIRFEPPHPSDDIYALGIIMCEIFGGSHPFKEKDAVTAIDRGLHPKLPALPSPCWHTLLLRCLASERAQRIADADALLLAIEECAAASF